MPRPWLNVIVGIVVIAMGVSEITGGQRTGNVWKGLIFGILTIIVGLVVAVRVLMMQK